VRRALRDGTIGKPVSALVSRHITRGSARRSAAACGSRPRRWRRRTTWDFVLWCLEPAKPVRVYSQGELRRDAGGGRAGARIPDTQWLTVTMDSGLSFVIGAGWSLPPGLSELLTTWIEMVGTEGAVMVDDSHRDVVVNTLKHGMQLPMSSMPGERVEHTFAGPMAAETIHFLEACALDRPVMVTPEHARMVMEVYLAADLSAERNAAVELPASNERQAKGLRKTG
jgi:scyllo-inositol 2-dehydrogenase (NAD+)